ncbi:DUF2332 domain-containing protein [Kitasatospora sp. NPDC096147]|uniref:DUF2332 domain-containing protein n=1 Tax=Kitasatospora sp. NPDC096147 TaxID=3364093 RepID=UPI003817E7C7
MSLTRTAAMFERQADACAELGSPLYAFLLRRAAQDLLAGGPCATAVAGHEDAPGPDAIGLRLMGGVHALVLSGQAPALAAHYPSVGGDCPLPVPESVWHAFLATVAEHPEWLKDWLTRPPQTNETGRANLLIAGTLHALGGADLPVRLFELGSSAGLNLLADHFRCEWSGPGRPGGFGPVDSPVLLADAWHGSPPAPLDGPTSPAPLRFSERRGCDLDPIDPRTPEGLLALRSYVWADQPERAARLAGAAQLAGRLPSTVERAGAADFLRGVSVREGALTVVWHSVMRQYVPAEEWALVEAELDRLAAESTPAAPFAHVSFEPRRTPDWREHRFLLTVRTGQGPEAVLAEAAPHGLPARTLS